MNEKADLVLAEEEEQWDDTEILHTCPKCGKTWNVVMYPWEEKWWYINEGDLECPGCGAEGEPPKEIKQKLGQ